MITCPNCGAQMSDGSAFCTNCGNALGGNNAQGAGVQGAQQAGNTQGNPQMGNMQGNPQMGPQMNMQGNPQMGMPQQMYVDPTDHTAEFDRKDVSDNKVIAMVPYLMGTVGIIIALLAAKESAYAGFHVRQALKFEVITVLLALITAVLCWTVIVPIAAGICVVVLLVVKIIAFIDVCNGKAKEPLIIKSLGFLK